jgi:hypothetical integral membrane protein (TIGR02206 family)
VRAQTPLLLIAEPFRTFGSAHLLAVLAASLGIGGLLCWMRRGPQSRRRTARQVCAAQIVLAHLIWHGASIARGEWNLGKHLPFHLCDGAAFFAVLALLTRKPLFVEIAHYWGLAAAFPALFFPDLAEGPPSPYFWTYFLNHSGLVGAPLLLAFGEGIRLRRGSLMRAFVATNLWAVLAAFANAATGGNYMFLREPPPGGSPLDHMGPWPWYLAGAEVLALLLFLVVGRVQPREGGPSPAGMPAQR